MDVKVCVVFLLALLGISLALAAAGGISVEAAGLAAAGTGPYAAALQLMAPSTEEEEEAAPPPTASMLDLGLRRRVLSSVSTSSLNPNRAACLGKCPAPGGSYTGRGCQKAYQCSG